MNRIILIGNGFDKAHDLPTGYRDFMDSYWREFAKKYPESSRSSPCEDEFVKLENINGPKDGFDVWMGVNYGNDPQCVELMHFVKEIKNVNSYNDLKQLITEAKNAADVQFRLSFKNDFWKHISEKSCLETWLDIENEYYSLLKSYLKAENRNESVKKLNREFCQVKNRLEKYLTEVCKGKVTKIASIERVFRLLIDIGDIAHSKVDEFLDSILSEMSAFEPHRIHEIDEFIQNNPGRFILDTHEEARRRTIRYQILEKKLDDYITTGLTIVLNFNYTDTVQKLYVKSLGNGRLTIHEIINIHGELNSESNPIIFGYGDELDDGYKEIEKTNDNDFLDNIKSVHYSHTDNYRKLFVYLERGLYQVFVMGHSCGNSDRTLLNAIFEHPNCISVKQFYHAKGEEGNDYLNIYKNISRNFNDKKAMRDIVVNKEYCTPLVPYKTPE